MQRTVWAALLLLATPLLSGCLSGLESPAPAQEAPAPPPTFRLAWAPEDPRAGETISFEVIPDDPSDPVAEAAWNFGDGTGKHGLVPDKSYHTAGWYPVSVALVTLEGHQTTLRMDLVVRGLDGSMPGTTDAEPTPDDPDDPVDGPGTPDAGDQVDDQAGPPVAAINVSAPVIPLGHGVTLSASASHDPWGEGLDYAWDLGDGTTADGGVIEHTYQSEGTFEVRLTVTDASGAQDATTVQLEVDDDYYEQHVWFNWDSKQLDVLILGVEDPVVGATIQEAIQAWETGIAELDPEFASDLEFRVYWPGVDGVPPTDFDADIVFVPQGFMAVSPVLGTCTSTAPLTHEVFTSGPNAQYRVAAHEFGHCLGLSHVFYEDVEYDPPFDLMGGGRAERSCPSNLNLEILYMVFSGQTGTVRMPASLYHQAEEC